VSTSITIVGASVRAAAASAARAGLQVRAADLFADDDLRALCPTVRVANYPREFEAVLRAAPTNGWMYTGAIENYPRLVERMSKVAPLWGNPCEVLRAVRNPMQVNAALRAAALPCPAVQRDDAGIPADGTWLCKPLRSAGGSGIEWRRAGSHRAKRGHYFQQFVPGLAMSALYVATHSAAVLLGVTRQIVGGDGNGQNGFRYSGSIGPLDAPQRIADAFARIGDALAAQFDLRGLFGVDAIVNDGGVWPVEVNPRFPASAELYDWAGGVSTVGLHVAACRGDRLEAPPLPTTRLVYGKAIVFADRTYTVGDGLEKLAGTRIAHDWPLLADIPAKGSTIRTGEPIVTLFAAEQSEPRVLETLRAQTQSVLTALAR
jgi:predicted ATP-grasp superfamily ATP-dependent carboligase